jgi:ATP-dependent DNA ligase
MSEVIDSARPYPLSACQTVSTEKFERLDKTAYIMEPKVDGWRMQIEVDPMEGVRAWTRTSHDASRKMPMVEKALHQMAREAHKSFRLDGEAVFINEDGTPDYNFTARCLGSQTEVCIMKQNERGFLSFFAFDILRYNDIQVRNDPLDERKGLLETLMSVFLPSLEYVTPIIGDKPSYEQHNANVERFKEGSVLKRLSAPYAGKRHNSWLKWKEMETVDVKIIGYKGGQGKFEGQIGAIHWQAPDGTTGYCSGMDDYTRQYISERASMLVGTWIEIRHFGRLVDSYRHPQFIRFRPDKTG